jgi:hypothetical protein
VQIERVLLDCAESDTDVYARSLAALALSVRNWEQSASADTADAVLLSLESTRTAASIEAGAIATLAALMTAIRKKSARERGAGLRLLNRLRTIESKRTIWDEIEREFRTSYKTLNE